MLELLKQRRIISSILGTISFALSLSGYAGLDVTGLTDAIIKLIEVITAIGAIVLPVISFFFPKK